MIRLILLNWIWYSWFKLWKFRPTLELLVVCCMELPIETSLGCIVVVAAGCWREILLADRVVPEAGILPATPSFCCY